MTGDRSLNGGLHVSLVCRLARGHPLRSKRSAERLSQPMFQDWDAHLERGFDRGYFDA